MRPPGEEECVAGRVQDKVCVITGAAGFIGSASARRLAEEGGRLALADIDRDAVEAAAVVVRRAGGDAEAFVVDVTDPASVAELYAATARRFGRIDVCFNNAGILVGDDSDPVSTSLETWLRVVAVNQTSVFLCLKYQLPYLVAAGGGSIINTASMVALQGSATPQIAYDATKGAIVTISRDVAVTYARKRIRCNALCPGPVVTPLFRGIFGDDPQAAARRLVHSPTGRFGEPDEVAHAVVYLASDESSWTSGTAFLVDGAITNAYTTPLDEAGQARSG
jgi:NAD(P)-dependent dehydrogenase (short-subunit alcohol dehydrogenase family)